MLERCWILVAYHHDVKLQNQMSTVFWRQASSWHRILVTKYHNISCQLGWIYPDLDDCYWTFPLPRSFFWVPSTAEWSICSNPEVFFSPPAQSSSDFRISLSFLSPSPDATQLPPYRFFPFLLLLLQQGREILIVMKVSEEMELNAKVFRYNLLLNPHDLFSVWLGCYHPARTSHVLYAKAKI